jgi:hypothetical protein
MVIKEPKATLLHGVWFEAARLAVFDIQDVIVMRHGRRPSRRLRALHRASPKLSNASRYLRCRYITCSLHWPPECSPKGPGQQTSC